MLNAAKCVVTNTNRERVLSQCFTINFQRNNSITSSTKQLSATIPPNVIYSSKYLQFLKSNSHNSVLKANFKSSSLRLSNTDKFDLLTKLTGDSNHKNHDDKTYDSETESSTTNSLVMALSMLSFFHGFGNRDVEEDGAELTDAQKMKKMKPVEILIARGVLAMCDQEYLKADAIFQKALKTAQAEENEEQETLILNLIASNFYESGDLDAAENLFIIIIKRMISANTDPAHPAILELSLKLSSIYSKKQTTHDKALQGFKFVISNLLNKLDDLMPNVEQLDIQELSDERKNELALLGWAYDWFAKHLIAINDFSGATEMLKKALQISTKCLGPLHDQTLILLNDVGTTLAMNNLPEEGKTFIMKAVEGAIESQSKELASFYVNLALVDLKLKKLSEAKRYCEYSIELALKNGEHHNSQEVILLSKRCLNEVKRILEDDNKQ